MVLKNISAFSVRELDNQNAIIPFRTSQIAGSGVNKYISGNGGTYTFHASGFVNRANVRQLSFVGNGLAPTNYTIEFFMTSSLTSTNLQYQYTNINLRAMDTFEMPLMFMDADATETLHGKVTNNATTSGMWLEYIDVKFNRLLEVS